jgi:hypothetical protein
MAATVETNIGINVQTFKGLRHVSMRLRGGADEEIMEVAEEVVEVVEGTTAAAAPMSRKAIDAEVARLLEEPLPDFVKVRHIFPVVLMHIHDIRVLT